MFVDVILCDIVSDVHEDWSVEPLHLSICLGIIGRGRPVFGSQAHRHDCNEFLDKMLCAFDQWVRRYTVLYDPIVDENGRRAR